MATKTEVSPEYGKRELVISRPFKPAEATDDARLAFFFVDPQHLCRDIIRDVAGCFPKVYLEEAIALAFEAAGEALPGDWTRIKDFVGADHGAGAQPRVAFLVSNDTHANFLIHVKERFKNTFFMIPKIGDKDEAAASTLDAHGIPFVELGFSDTECPALAEFRPDLVMVGGDWTDEFAALHGITRRLGVPTVSLQEGPQYWHMTRANQYANKYRNAEVLCAQGTVTLRNIHPKYFTITGNPKVDRIVAHPLPPRPKVFINCNFTYGQWEECRQQWMEDCLSVCRELGLDYLISKHPRDTSTWDDPNLIESNAFKVKEQLLSSSIVISRLSSLPYEALAAGRVSVYYNPHGEPIPTFCEDQTPGIQKAFSREELREILLRHQQEMRFDAEAAHLSMREHCGPMDGNSLGRIIDTLGAIATSRPGESELLAAKTANLKAFMTGPERLTLIYAIKDRPVATLEKSIQSIRAASRIQFKINVVDYGSLPPCRDELRQLAAKLKFNLIRCETMGRPWSRAHALNIGARQANTEFIVFTDIDMLFEGDIFKESLKLYEPRCVVHCTPMWLPETGEKLKAKVGNHDQFGGYMLIERDLFAEIGGFDERFKFWGIEDHDMHNRQINYGIKPLWLDQFKDMYHLWHPLSYGFTSQQPENSWYDSVEMLMRNVMTPVVQQEWGRALTMNERPIFKKMNECRKPPYYRLNFNRMHLEFNQFFNDVLRNVQEGDFFMLGLQNRFTDTSRLTLEKYPKMAVKLRDALTRRGFTLTRITNRNIEYLCMSIKLLEQKGLKDYFIKDDYSAAYLLF